MTTRQDAHRALEERGEELAGYPNVVGLGIGDDHSVMVYVTEKVPREDLGPAEVLPRFVEVSGRDRARRVAVRVVAVGRITPQSTEDPGSDFEPQ